MQVLDKTTGQWKQIMLSSSLKNDLTSDSQTMAPTVHAVNEGIKNKINGNGSIGTIVECTFEEYKTLKANNQIDKDTEYHINDLTNTVSSDLQSMIIDNLTTNDGGKALSANQGVKLKALYDDCKDNIIRNHSGIMVMLGPDNLVWNCSGSGSSLNRFVFKTLTTTWGQGDSLFTFDNSGRVTIGKNVNTIKVSVHINANENDHSGKWIMGYVRKNTNPQIRTINQLTKWTELNTECILSVSEGDVIDFAVASDYQGQIIFPTYESSEWVYTTYGGMSYMIIENMG